MKRTGTIAGLVMAVVLCWLILPAVFADEVKLPKDEFTIDNRAEFKKSIKPPVPFTHKKHEADNKIACNECHHTYKDGKNVWKPGDPVQKCITCHPADRDLAKKKSDEMGVKLLDLKNAFHKDCKECHEQVDKEQGKKAPTQCNDCHKG